LNTVCNCNDFELFKAKDNPQQVSVPQYVYEQCERNNNNKKIMQWKNGGKKEKGAFGQRR